MGGFIKAALPFVLIGISLGIFYAGYSRKHKNKSSGDEEKPKDSSGMTLLLGVAAGIAIGTAADSIGASLGAGIGMLIGSIIEYINSAKV